jgi:RHS repeat-associated protein
MFPRIQSGANSYLYNQGSESNTNTGWYETMFRDYDPVLGRFMQVDPLAAKYDSWSHYHYAFNDPVFWNDPSGADSRGFYWYKYVLNTSGEREYSEGAIYSMYGAAWNMATYGSYTGAGGAAAGFARSGGGRWVTFVCGVSRHQPRYGNNGTVTYEFHYGQAFVRDGAKGPEDGPQQPSPTQINLEIREHQVSTKYPVKFRDLSYRGTIELLRSVYQNKGNRANSSYTFGSYVDFTGALIDSQGEGGVKYTKAFTPDGAQVVAIPSTFQLIEKVEPYYESGLHGWHVDPNKVPTTWSNPFQGGRVFKHP